MLAEGALRNLHLDCHASSGGEAFSSRMLHLVADGLIIDDPDVGDCGPALAEGDRITCSARLGREIFRFGGVVGGHRWFQLNAEKRVPAVLLIDVTDPVVVQRRRYYRVSLAGHGATDVTCWIVEQEEVSARVCDEVSGLILDVSGGGAGMLTEHGERLAKLDGKQLWARFRLPGENESLIFRVALRHIRRIEVSGQFHVGLEFVEYIDPGEHQKVLDHLVRYVSQQERVELRRRKDR